MVLILLLIGLSAVFLGSYLTLTYTPGKEVKLFPYPPYSTGRTVTGTLTSGTPNFTKNVSYFSLYDPIGSLYGVTPYLVGYFEANDSLSFYINLIGIPPEENPIFSVSNVSKANFSVAGKTDYSGFGIWELQIHNDSASDVNFTIHYYQQIHSFANFLVGQKDIVISSAQLHMYNDSYLAFVYYESALLFVNVGGGFLLAIYSLGGAQNLPILSISYILMIFGGATALGAALELISRRRVKKEQVKESR
nr:hypothetical protein [Candidatus Freyarchaeota archaeon]